MIKNIKRKSSSSLLTDPQKQPRMEAEDYTIVILPELLILIFTFLDPFFVADNVRLVCKRWRISASNTLRQFMLENERYLRIMKSFFEYSNFEEEVKLLCIGFPVNPPCSSRNAPCYTKYPDLFPLNGPSDYWEQDLADFWSEVRIVLRTKSWDSFSSLFVQILKKCRYFCSIVLHPYWNAKLYRCRMNMRAIRLVTHAKKSIRKEKLEKKDTGNVGVLEEHTHLMNARFPIHSIESVPFFSQFLWLPGKNDNSLTFKLTGFTCRLMPNGNAIFIVEPSKRKFCDDFCQTFLEELQGPKAEDLSESTLLSTEVFLESFVNVNFEWKPLSIEEMKRRSKSILKSVFEYGGDDNLASLIAYGLPDIKNECTLPYRFDCSSGVFLGDFYTSNAIPVDFILPRNPLYYIDAFKNRHSCPKSWASKCVWNLVLYDVLRILDLWPLITTQRYSRSEIISYFSTEAFVSIIPQLVGCETLSKRWKPFVDPWFKALERPKVLVFEGPENSYSPPCLKSIDAMYTLTDTEQKKLAKKHRLGLFGSPNSIIYCRIGSKTLAFTGGKCVDDYEDLLAIIKKNIG